jgi:hypothetical protein
MRRFQPATTRLTATFAFAVALVAASAPAVETSAKLAGTVTRADKGRIEVKQADGKVQEVLVTPGTVFAAGKVSATIADVRQGSRVTVETTKGKGGLEAMKVQIEAATVIYTCPMHPEIQQPGPGKCPKCGMNLAKKA